MPDNEFKAFINNQAVKKYIKPKKLNVTSLLNNWRTCYHLIEDLMHFQITKKHINKNTLKVPFIFEYLMEHIENKDAIKDPDIFMLNAISPKECNIDHSFAFQRKLSPDYDDKKEKENANKEDMIKTTDINAIPILQKQIYELSKCKPINITDHHHAIILLKLWFHQSPEPILPYYLYERVCSFNL